MQQIADRAGVAIGTLYLHAGTKAELLIMVQNQKFAAAIDDAFTLPEILDHIRRQIIAVLARHLAA